MKNKFLLLCSLLLVTFSSWSQAMVGYNFKIKIKGVSDTTLMLAHHYGDQQYVIDTVRINNKSEAEFRSNDTLIGGIYLVVLPSMSNKYFEFIVSSKESTFSLETDTADFAAVPRHGPVS